MAVAVAEREGKGTVAAVASRRSTAGGDGLQKGKGIDREREGGEEKERALISLIPQILWRICRRDAPQNYLARYVK